jgi:hypothetical protein
MARPLFLFTGSQLTLPDEENPSASSPAGEPGGMMFRSVTTGVGRLFSHREPGARGRLSIGRAK